MDQKNTDLEIRVAMVNVMLNEKTTYFAQYLLKTNTQKTFPNRNSQLPANKLKTGKCWSINCPN